ncbi:outer membrane protein TolC [Hymenobacter luteus]|uniref:Outer membrane protein TolC n=2 Tax=Hymenobacter TaxID=89966 RepID=A0A7W9T1H7_9BACT|nr:MULTISPECIES: TolC family protein [Hymenobacter]MBB4600724.1 outer membrane protein TolC [Hymenobacter latericoloratus]MBB6059069.1 outer membrane protein TolC [Hymenobacter luteus]
MSRSVLAAFLLAAPLPLLAQQPVLPSRQPTTQPQSKPQTEKPETVAPAPFLTLADAIRTGIENNYNIRLSRQDVRIAENNVTRGNAGQLPTVNGNFTRTFNRNNVRQESSSRPEPSIANNAKSNLLNGNVAATWTIFDGFGMFIAYDRLQALEQSQRQLTRATLEETVAAITDAYFVVVRESGKINSIEEALKIGQARIDLTQARVDVGVSAKVEVLTARVDYNADRSALIQQQEALKTAKINLNNLLGRNPNLDFQPADSIVVSPNLNRDVVLQAVRQNNPRLQQARLNTEVATYDRRLVRASRFPQIGLTTGYGLNRNINGAAFFGTQLVTNTGRTYGLNYGVVASVPIFDGFNRNRLEQNARIVEEQSRLQLDQAQLQLDAEAEQAWAQYQNRLQLLELEEANILLARENVAIALERYRLGLLTPLALREAQRTQLDAEVRLLDIRYQAKQAEIILRRLSSGLVQEGTVQP